MRNLMRAFVVLALVATSLFALGAAAQANHRCSYLTITPTTASYYEGYNTSLNFWYLSSWRYISSTTHCDRAVTFNSSGWGFEFYTCGTMWVRVMRRDGSTFPLSGSTKTVCGGQQVVLASGQPPGRAFRVEGRRSGSREQGTTSPFIGLLRN